MESGKTVVIDFFRSASNGRALYWSHSIGLDRIGRLLLPRYTQRWTGFLRPLEEERRSGSSFGLNEVAQLMVFWMRCVRHQMEDGSWI